MDKVLVVIPARGGSKGIPDKNITLLNGKPLIQYTVDLAKELGFDIHVSTDSRKIANVVRGLGVEVPQLRDKELAQDNTSTLDVLLSIDYTGYDKILLLQPTSPIRTKEDCLKALNMVNTFIDMVVSVSKVEYYNLYKDIDGWLEPISKVHDQRQEAPTTYKFNGAIFAIKVGALKTFKTLRLPCTKYIETFTTDIDTLQDLKYTEFLLQQNN